MAALLLLLGLASVGALGDVAAQSVPSAPHVIFGIVTDDDGSVLSGFRVDVLLDDAVAGTTFTDAFGFYSLQLSALHAGREARLRFDGVTAGPAVRLVDGHLSQLDYRVSLGARRTVLLRPGFNLVVWTGPVAPLESVLAEIAGDVDRAFAWDAARQRFLIHTLGALPALNTLITLRSGEPLWLHVRAGHPVVWEVPLTVERQSVSLVPGWNLVPWTGTNSVPAAEAFAPLGDRLTRAFGWALEARAFRTHLPNAPGPVNTLTALPAHSPIWLEISPGEPLVWDQP